MTRLQGIVTAMESGEMPLEQGQICTVRVWAFPRLPRTIGKARNDIRVYTEGALQPFAADGEEAEETLKWLADMIPAAVMKELLKERG